MINTKKIALLVDVDNVKIGGEAFNELYSKLNEIGEVVYCKFYGYNDRKHIYLTDAISRYGYDTAPFMRYKKRFSQLDNRMIVDAIKLNYTKVEIDTYCIVAGDGDLIPLLVELKSSGRTLIDVNTPYQEQNYHMFDAHINLTMLTLEVETYKPKAKKAARSVERSSSAVASTKEISQKTTVTKSFEQTGSHGAATSYSAPNLNEIVVDNAVISDYQMDEEDDTMDFNDKLGDTLRDITNRYSELDFTNDSDLQKKRNLIYDIENLINSETQAGEGLKSGNEDVRQIFVELKNIVDDMKNSL